MEKQKCFQAEIGTSFLSYFSDFHLNKSKQYEKDWQRFYWKEKLKGELNNFFCIL